VVEASAEAVAGVPEEVEPAVAGRDSTVLTRRERRTVDGAVKAAETSTGLQFCVYLGPGQEDARTQAEALFVAAGLHERPAVLLLVAPDHRRVEVVTAPAIRERLTDEACSRVITEMTPFFADKRYVDGLVTGIQRLAAEAGPGAAADGTTDFPNIVGD
jgi:uncharacterized membrane protein YgcG